jgi:hypothetical protein
MAKADRDDALDTLVRVSLRDVREDRNSIRTGVEVVRGTTGRHRSRCRIAVTPGGSAEQEDMRHLPHTVRFFLKGYSQLGRTDVTCVVVDKVWMAGASSYP